MFDEIKHEHIEPALDEILSSNRKSIEQLNSNTTTPCWENFIQPLEDMDDRLERMWAPVSHLNGVRDNEELRQVYQGCLQKLTEYSSELGQNLQLFQGIKSIYESGQFTQLNQAQQKSIENDLRSFRLSGVDLPAREQQRFRDISNQISQLTNQFSRNVMDATDGWSLHITDEADLAGLPQNAIQIAAENAAKSGQKGWLFSLQAPSFIPFLTFADNRELRKQMYRAYVTRASEVGPNAGKWDNASLINEILELRQEKANLLGFENYAEYSLETKMAESVEQVEQFLLDLAKKSKLSAEKDLEELAEYARLEWNESSLEAWDLAWYSEKLRQHRFDFSSEKLREYFPLPVVLSGLFETVEKLFGIRVVETERPQVWHPDVYFYQIVSSNGNSLGHFYLDLYSREQKRGGAWMAECINRRKCGQKVQTPVAYLTCNFSQPVDGKPSLLTHDEVMTLFHEFGHGLHHMLTQIDVAAVSGINGVPWDAVELPSQFLENWCWEREALDFISRHYQTNEPLDDDFLDKMKAAKNFQSGMQMLRQIEFSLFDLRIHAHSSSKSDDFVQKTLDRVRQEVAVIRPPDFNRFQNGFSHIFAGGYAAGYYSYKWAEVLSADAFSRFEKEGIFNQATGQSFLEEILVKGGSDDPMSLFVAFRGRKPTVDALLRHSGLSTENKAA